MTSAHIDMICVHVRDKETAKQWHREKLGFEQCARTPRRNKGIHSRPLGNFSYIQRCRRLGLQPSGPGHELRARSERCPGEQQ